MIKKAYKIDKDGFYIEDYIYEENQELESDIITTDIQQGLYKPKWDGEKWVEGATEEYKNSMKAPLEPTPEEILRAKLIKDNATMQLQLVQQQELNADMLLKIAKLGGATNV